MCYFFFFQAEDGIRDYKVTGVQTCALPICREIERRHDDLGPPPIVEGFRQARERDRDARRERDLRRRRAHQPAVAAPQLGERRPPHVVPRGGAARLPEIEKLAEPPAGALAERPERARVEV